jgi:3-oxoacyl-[acyl-carrier protein] reductase
MANNLSEQVVIVTGGSRGIGEAIVRRLASDGARVYATYNSGADKANQITAELSELGQFVSYHQVNVTDEQSIKSFVEEVVAKESRIDGVVNNAGITKDGLLMRMSESDWDVVMDTNLKSVFTMTKTVIRQMMSQRRGRIVNIASVVGITGNAGQANYVASKAGLIGFTKSVAKEVASRNILVNCVAPGYIETEMTGKLTEEQLNAFLNVIPLKRAGKGEEIASVVSFLLSPDSQYITGQTITVDGGMVM